MSAIAHARPDTADAERGGRALMVGGGLLLGTLGVFVDAAGQHPLTAVWARCLFGALALGLWGAATGRLGALRPANRRTMLTLVAAGGLVLLNWTLFFAALERLPIGIATVAVHVQPVWVLAIAALVLGERVTRGQALAVAGALGGLALASGVATPGALASAGSGLAAGLVLCVASSLGYAAVTLIAHRSGIDGFTLAWWQCAVGTVALAWWPWWHGLPAPAMAWAWLAGLGVLHTGLAYVLLYAGMARLPAGPVAVLQFVYPGSALLIDAVFYGHRLDGLQLAGVALMGAALLRVKRA